MGGRLTALYLQCSWSYSDDCWMLQRTVTNVIRLSYGKIIIKDTSFNVSDMYRTFSLAFLVTITTH